MSDKIRFPKLECSTDPYDMQQKLTEIEEWKRKAKGKLEKILIVKIADLSKLSNAFYQGRIDLAREVLEMLETE